MGISPGTEAPGAGSGPHPDAAAHDAMGLATDAELATDLATLEAFVVQRTNHSGQQSASTISDFNVAVRTNRLDQLAVPTASLVLNGQRATGAADPTQPQDLATRAYVLAIRDALIASAPGLMDTLDEIAAALGDDPNFAATITSALAGKQGLHANLTAVAGLTLIADRLVYANGAGTLTLTAFTAAARALLDDIDASAMLTTLGVSTFVKTLLDDANQAAAQATLGVVPRTDVVAGATRITVATSAPGSPATGDLWVDTT